MFCHQCGAALEGKPNHCDRCGAQISDNLQNPSVVENLLENKTRLAIGGGVIVAVVILIITLNTQSSVRQLLSSANYPSRLSSSASSSAGSLTIASINPATVIDRFTNIITIKGSGFDSNATVKINGKEVVVTGAVPPDILYIQYKGDLSPGTYNVTVINTDATEATLTNGLHITAGSENVSGASAVELTPAQITKKITPSLVLIRTNFGCGSGVIINSNGTILTDDHVIKNANFINAYLSNGVSFRAFVIKEDSQKDLATLSINTSGLTAASFGSSDESDLSLGSNVYAFGYPLTCNTDQVLEVEQGIVTARRYDPDLGDVIQTSARINPGDSGGPLVDASGKVVGLNESIFSLSNLDLNVTGIAFATPITTVHDFLSGVSNNFVPPAPQSPAPSSPPPSNPRQFTLNANGICDNNSNGTILLTGYPYANGYSIPNIDITYWFGSTVSFIVPTDVSAGTYQVTITGYEPGTGYCPTVRAGAITVQ